MRTGELTPGTAAGAPRPRVLVVGHGAAASGFARVTDAIIAHLPGRYRVEQLAVNHRTDTVAAPWTAHGNPRLGDVHGLERAAELVARRRPDAVLIVGDLWFVVVHLIRLAAEGHRPATVAYCPVDGELTDHRYAEGLAGCDRLVAYTGFGRDQLRRLGLRVDAVIPHGVDAAAFRPLAGPERAAARAALFGADAADAFVVLNANKHQPRKRLDLTIEGFARFARDKPPGVRLYLHTTATAAADGVLDLVHASGIGPRLLLAPGEDPRHPALPDDRLNLLYNACDVGLNTAAGEGWGLVGAEHAAAGAAQVVPRHSACAELWAGTALQLDPVYTYEDRALGMLRHAVDPDDVAGALDLLYHHPAERRRLAEAGRRWVTGDEYRWPAIGARWDALLGEVTGLPPGRDHDDGAQGHRAVTTMLRP
ncbi:glycosyltransferase family protein [Dactylosporangium sp. CA-052675]|uniref:glycosyltransferase family protein n=1 Tax=Dactylosporangium sp. CA-052675 TaxID=3239927 RepID=UPI003D934826